jgi:hypothetical protein
VSDTIYCSPELEQRRWVIAKFFQWRLCEPHGDGMLYSANSIIAEWLLNRGDDEAVNERHFS